MLGEASAIRRTSVGRALATALDTERPGITGLFTTKGWLEMKVLAGTQMLLLISTAAVFVVTSCNGPDTRTGREQSGPSVPRDLAATALSRDEIIAIANAAARQEGWDLEACDVTYDEGNANWRSMLGGVVENVKMARRRGLDSEAYSVIPDEEDADWKSYERVLLPEVNERDYQVVMYTRRAVLPGAALYVLVHRQTGKVLKVLTAG
jgi:hypothetical protein